MCGNLNGRILKACLMLLLNSSKMSPNHPKLFSQLNRLATIYHSRWIEEEEERESRRKNDQCRMDFSVLSFDSVTVIFFWCRSVYYELIASIAIKLIQLKLFPLRNLHKVRSSIDRINGNLFTSLVMKTSSSSYLSTSKLWVKRDWMTLKMVSSLFSCLEILNET